MAITYRDSSSAFTASVGAALSVAKPATVVEADWMVALVCLDRGQVSIDLAGWSSVPTTRISTSASAGGDGYGVCSALLADKFTASAGLVGTAAATTVAAAIGREFTFILHPPSAEPDGPVPDIIGTDQPGVAQSTWPVSWATQGRIGSAAVYAMPVSTTPIWTYSREGSFDAALEQGLVIGADGTLWAIEGVDAGSPGSMLHAINTDGTRRLIRVLSGSIYYGPMACNQHGDVYVQAGAGQLNCYRHDGTLRWATSLLGSSSSVVMDSSGNIYGFGGGDAAGSGLRSATEDGELRWTYRVVDQYFGNTSLGMLAYDASDELLYMGVNVYNPSTFENTYLIYQVDLTGTVTASFDLTAHISDPNIHYIGTPFALDGRIYVSYATWSAAFVVALDATPGNITAAWDYTAGWPATTACDASTLYIDDSSASSLVALNAADGSVKWTYDPGGTYGPVVSVAQDCLVCYNGTAKTIEWHSLEDGSLLDSASVPTVEPSGPGFGRREVTLGDSIALFAGDSVIYAFQTVPTPVPPEPPAPTITHDQDCYSRMRRL